MIKLFELLMHGCWHRWRAMKSIDLMDKEISETVPIGTRYTYQCEKCHRIKKLDVK